MIGHSASSRPLLVKISPDLSFEAMDDILELVSQREISGIVATNTTITRPSAGDPDLQRIYAETGGLSGRPLRARSTEMIRHIYRTTSGKLPIIGVGGVFNAADAWEKLTAGASLIQLYTGLVYLTPIIGGVIADRWLGRTRTITIGASLMAIGHFLMAFDFSFLLALLLGGLPSETGRLEPGRPATVAVPPAEKDRTRLLIHLQRSEDSELRHVTFVTRFLSPE